VKIRALFAILFASLLTLLCRRAEAYPWMIRHEYANCTACHADPSGGGLLTEYGRAQGEVTMRTPLFRKTDDEPGKVADFAFGAFKVPDGLLLGGDVRALYIKPTVAGAPSIPKRLFLMQADLQAQLKIERFRVNGSIGFAQKGAEGARITSSEENNLVSRVHWAGYEVGEDKEVLVRAGRMNVPFGIRSVEHTMWARTQTRTDTNSQQQYGAAISYNTEGVRGELMAIAGNFAVSPDEFRSRGYAGYLEYAPMSKLALGASSMITWAELDEVLKTPAFRQAHGGFIRYSPAKLVVISSEIDVLHTSQQAPGTTSFGSVGHVTADFEPIQGLHLASTFEVGTLSFKRVDPRVSAWASAWWFFLPHADIRIDGIAQSGRLTPFETRQASSATLLMQLHMYL
jgi:hypothetical protein